MPRCHPIALLELDARSKQGIKRIQRLQTSAKISTLILAGGKVADILYRNQPSTQFRNISTSDWNLFFKALQGLPKAYKMEIEKEADYQQLDHMTDRDQRLFWEGIRDGCKPN